MQHLIYTPKSLDVIVLRGHTYLLQTTGAAGSETPGWVACTGTGAPVRADSPTFTTMITSPLLLGGGANNSTLTFQPTSHGTAVSGSDIIFKVGNNGAIEPLRILYDGSLRITGTNVHSYLRFGADEIMYLRGGKTGSGVNIQDTHSGNVEIAVGGGKVGVGVTPAATLHVIGNGTDDIFRAARSGTTRLVVKNAANAVGINCDTVTSPLQVVGLPTGITGLGAGAFWLGALDGAGTSRYLMCKT